MNGEFSAAVHALVYLNHKNTSLTSEALAENICTNPARVRKIMAKLKKSGLVETKEGADGGYLFCKAAQNVTLLFVLDCLGAPVVKPGWRSGSEDMDCLVASGMAGIMDGICAELNELCRQKLSLITIDDIDKQIFKKSENEELV